MLNNEGFDLWADGYDQTVGISDDEGTYPFAGYKQILNEIYNRVLAGKYDAILDIGFGTGALATKLYEQGCRVWGQDTSFAGMVSLPFSMSTDTEKRYWEHPLHFYRKISMTGTPFSFPALHLKSSLPQIRNIVSTIDYLWYA